MVDASYGKKPPKNPKGPPPKGSEPSEPEPCCWCKKPIDHCNAAFYMNPFNHPICGRCGADYFGFKFLEMVEPGLYREKGGE